MLRQQTTFNMRKRFILNQAKKNNEIVYGAQAMNANSSILYSRPTFDWDLYSKNHKKSARQLEQTLDHKSGKDTYYVKPALHPNTTKVMHKGFDNRRGTRDDFGVADYSKKPRGVKTKKIKGVRYVRMSAIEKDRKKSLRDKESKFRHHKDRMDLRRINANRVYQRKFRRRK